MTNRDRINEMSNVELAECIKSIDESGEFDMCNFCAFSIPLRYPDGTQFLCDNNCESVTCVDGIKQWLESEVEE